MIDRCPLRRYRRAVGEDQLRMRYRIDVTEQYYGPLAAATSQQITAGEKFRYFSTFGCIIAKSSCGEVFETFIGCGIIRKQTVALQWRHVFGDCPFFRLASADSD